MSNLANENHMEWHTITFSDLKELSMPLLSGKYKFDGQRIFYTAETKKGTEERTVFPHAIVPVAFLLNVDSHTEKIRLAFKNQCIVQGEWQYVTVARSVLSDVTKIKTLADYGISVNSDTAHDAMNYLCTLLDYNRNNGAIAAKYSTARLGWADSHYQHFMPYDREYIEFDGDKSLENKLAYFELRGEINKWLYAVAAEYQKPYNAPFRLVMAASMGSILLKPLNRQLFTLILWGATGTGKTVAMQAAASCWGNPAAQNALIGTLDSTEVARERLYGFYGDLPIFMDELQTLRVYGGDKTTAYDKLIMHHSGGEGRARGSTAEKLQYREHWNGILLLTGEEPTTKENSQGGAKNRVIEVEVGQKLFDNPAAFVRILSENYGLVGFEWVKYVKWLLSSGEIEVLQQELIERTTRITRTMHTDQKQASAAAFLLTVDKLLCRAMFGDFDIEPLEDEDIAPFVKDTTAINTGDRAFDDVISWVSSQKHCFEEPALSPTDYPKETLYQCYGKIKAEEGRIIIIAATLRELLESKGYDLRAVTQQWLKTGKLERSNNSIQCRDRINGIPTRTYRLIYQFD